MIGYKAVYAGPTTRYIVQLDVTGTVLPDETIMRLFTFSKPYRTDKAKVLAILDQFGNPTNEHFVITIPAQIQYLYLLEKVRPFAYICGQYVTADMLPGNKKGIYFWDNIIGAQQYVKSIENMIRRGETYRRIMKANNRETAVIIELANMVKAGKINRIQFYDTLNKYLDERSDRP